MLVKSILVAIAAGAGVSDALCPFASAYRRDDGKCNNIKRQSLGAKLDSYFTMGTRPRSEPTKTFVVGRSFPRLISNVIHHQAPEEDVRDRRGLTHWIMQWGQFVDHDLALTTAPAKDKGARFAHILIKEDYEFHGRYKSPTDRIAFTRNADWQEDDAKAHLTHWLDASAVYGSDSDLLTALLVPGTAKLALTKDGLLGNLDDGKPQAGDERADVQPGLAAIHILMVREHNRLVDIITAANITDDTREIFDIARMIVEAEEQKITWEDWLPALLGVKMQEQEYDPEGNVAVFRMFSGALLRSGHTMINNDFLRFDHKSFDPATKTYKPHAKGPFRLHKNFFKDEERFAEIDNKIEPVVIGLFTQPMQRIDNKIIDSMRNHLFEGHFKDFADNPAFATALDIVSINLQRGRDLGLFDYRSARALLSGTVIEKFSDVTTRSNLRKKLRAVYRHQLDNIDLFSGMLCEDHVPGSSTGPTLRWGFMQQFAYLQRNDRFWYRPRLTRVINEQCGDAKWRPLCAIMRGILDGSYGLDDVIRANTEIPFVPDNVFVRPGFEAIHSNYTVVPQPKGLFTIDIPPYDRAEDPEDLPKGADGQDLRDTALFKALLELGDDPEDKA